MFWRLVCEVNFYLNLDGLLVQMVVYKFVSIWLLLFGLVSQSVTPFSRHAAIKLLTNIIYLFANTTPTKI